MKYICSRRRFQMRLESRKKFEALRAKERVKKKEQSARVL